MARNISSASLAKLATRFGTEPIVIIEIQWVDGGERTAYSDRDIEPGIKGAVLELDGLDDVVQVSGGSNSQQISFTLNDTDGEIKAIMDSQDMHKRPCWVYQWFDGLDTSEKFLIFKGVLNTPIEWDEGARTIKVDVISKIEDVEVGFSIEEGDFINPPEELIGKPWPLCFGTVINVPALRTASARRGILATGTGIRDFTLEKRLAAANALTCPISFTGYKFILHTGTVNFLEYQPTYQTDASCAKSKCELIESLTLQLSEQKTFEITPVRIFGGNNFPQNKTITLNINGGKFVGSFSGEIFTITGRLHPDNDGHGVVIQTDFQKTIASACPGANGTEIVATTGNAETDAILIAAGRARATQAAYDAIKPASFFWANAGSTVTLADDEQILYIANLLPSTVLRVAAVRELSGGSQLITVPSEYYTIRETNYTGYTAVVEIVFHKPLSLQDLKTGGGWSDDIYVTLTSSVGPNTVDILEWFIETYTSYGIDSTSFDATRTLIDNYPMHFPLLERKNIIQVLEEIAYQARCALWLKDDVFYIKYLSLEPAADGAITETDVLSNSLRIEHTSTEDLVTKYVAKWRKDYAVEKPNTVMLRHNANTKKYGTHEATYDFYCFNILELVRKSATFWLIRKSNTWRRLIFRTPISKLNLETFDTVNVTLPDAVNGTVKCVVEKANYNSDSKTLDFELWTPCKSGTKDAEHFAWPADVAELDLFPTIEERTLGLAGSGNQPNFSVIAPKNHPLANEPSGPTSISLGSCGLESSDLVTGQCRSDHGDSHPSDRNDHKPVPNASSDQTGEISAGSSPITNGPSSSCCQEALDKANQALKEAQQARSEGQRDKSNDDAQKNVDDAKNDLPSSCGGNCTATVHIQYITPTQVLKPPGSDTTFGTKAGDKGKLVLGNNTNNECYSFNSQITANAFADSKQAEKDGRDDSYGWTVGKNEPFLITRSADLGIDSETMLPCPEPDSADRAMTAFKNTP